MKMNGLLKIGAERKSTETNQCINPINGADDQT